jgi:hypothetical protein
MFFLETVLLGQSVACRISTSVSMYVEQVLATWESVLDVGLYCNKSKTAK